MMMNTGMRGNKRKKGKKVSEDVPVGLGQVGNDHSEGLLSAVLVLVLCTFVISTFHQM